MDDALRIAVQWLHVLAGVVWIGAGYYVTFVQLPALASMPLPARGPALLALGPRQVRYILRRPPAVRRRQPRCRCCAAASSASASSQLTIGTVILLAMVTARFS